MKPADVQMGIYIEYCVEHNIKDHKFKVGDHVRISKYKNIFAKFYTPNWSEKDFVIKKVKDTLDLACVICDLNREDIIETFYEKEQQRTCQKKKKEID